MLKFNSKPGNVAQVEPFVEKLMSKYQISPDRQGDILISVTEAVTNAIVHGNRKDEEKVVQVRHQRRRNCLSVRISDEGTGFDTNGIADPTTPENCVKLGGRGVFLMRQLADKLRFFNNGSTVEMQFRLR